MFLINLRSPKNLTDDDSFRIISINKEQLFLLIIIFILFYRYTDENLILLERTYPRRNTYIILANIGKTNTIKDLSSIFYGGQVILDHEGNSGYSITFHKLILNPGEIYLIKIDL